MPTRRAARERALGLAYECEQRNVRGPELLGGLPVPPDEYAQILVVGVDEHHERSTRSSGSIRSTGRWSGCRWSIVRCCASARTS